MNDRYAFELSNACYTLVAENAEYETECQSGLTALFDAAMEVNPFGLMCTVVRSTGVNWGHTDPLEELHRALDDFGFWATEALETEKRERMIRVFLLTYMELDQIVALHERRHAS